MFLANLMEQQKSAFLSLAQTLVAADGVLCDSEAAMMEQYKQEMSLPRSAEILQQPSEQSAAAFESAPLTIKKQVVFELVALACADDDYADEEHHLLKQICTMFNLDLAFLGECRTYVRELTGLYERIGKLVSE